MDADYPVMTRDAVFTRRKRLWAMGYRPYAVWSPGAVDHRGESVRNAGKRAWGLNWCERAREDPPWATVNFPDPQALNTGLLTGELVAVDIDILDPEIVDQVCALTESVAGVSPLVRQGRAPKLAICYRASSPYHKIATAKLQLREAEPGGKPVLVEILGQGQGLVVDGIHPETAEPYQWFGDTPEDVRLEVLPVLDEEPARELIGRIEAWLREHCGLVDWVDPNRRDRETPPPRERPARHGNGSLSGSGFFDQVRELALARVEDWLPWIFPKAKKAPNGAWRSPATERGLPDTKQDLSVHPTDGIVDFHNGNTFTAIDLVMTYGTAGGETIEQRALQAALWLCERMHVDPHAFGYQDQPPRSARPPEVPGQAPGGNGHDKQPPVWPPAPPVGPNGGGNGAAGRVIMVRAGLRHEAADEGLAALVADGIGLYTRGIHLVEVLRTKAKDSRGHTIMIPELGQVSATNMARHLGRIAEWQRFDKRLGGWVRFDPPAPIVDMVLGMINEWKFPPITGLAATPTLRPDGSLLVEPGYDMQTGMVLIFDRGFCLPAIAAEPSKTDAAGALALLCELIEHFPFVDRRSRSVALSLLMTPVVRSAMDVAPLHAVTAPLPGTGKSYLIDLAATIATGERAAVQSMAPKDEETEKRLMGAALGGYPIIALDNVSRLVEGDFLAQISERPYLRIRPLGTSDTVRIKNTFSVIVDGNNLAFGSDMLRRTIKCGLDANMADPETRRFPFDPIQRVLGDRGRYVAAVLTIVHAFAVSGEAPLPPVGSYQQWSDWVRSPLVWLGEDDPLGTMQDLRDDDPARQRRAEIFELWVRLPLNDKQHEHGITGAELIEMAEIIVDMREALMEIAEGHSRSGFAGKIDPRRLGIWLRSNQNAVAGDYKLVANRADKRRPRWSVVRVS